MFVGKQYRIPHDMPVFIEDGRVEDWLAGDVVTISRSRDPLRFLNTRTKNSAIFPSVPTDWQPYRKPSLRVGDQFEWAPHGVGSGRVATLIKVSPDGDRWTLNPPSPDDGGVGSGEHNYLLLDCWRRIEKPVAVGDIVTTSGLLRPGMVISFPHGGSHWMQIERWNHVTRDWHGVSVGTGRPSRLGGAEHLAKGVRIEVEAPRPLAMGANVGSDKPAAPPDMVHPPAVGQALQADPKDSTHGPRLMFRPHPDCASTVANSHSGELCSTCEALWSKMTRRLDELVAEEFAETGGSLDQKEARRWRSRRWEGSRSGVGGMICGLHRV